MRMKTKKPGFETIGLPVLDQGDPTTVGLEQVCQMVDAFMERGFTYFDATHMCHRYESERVVKRVPAERWSRERCILADKLPLNHLKEEVDIGHFFREQLGKCGAAYFDYHMLHNMFKSYYKTAERLRVFEFVCRKKEGGEVRKIGFSFRTDAELLEEILGKHPKVGFMQLQLNCTDWNNPNIQFRQCYEVCRRYGKDVIVIELVKGGTPAHVPQETRGLMEAHAPGMTPASWAVHSAVSREGVVMVLSGMSDYSQLPDNAAHM